VAVMTLVEAINHTLHQEMERDDRVLVFGQDVARNGGVFRATDGLLDRFGGKRVVDTPLSEAVIIGTAVGLAAEGMVPVPEIQFLGFSWQAFHSSPVSWPGSATGRTGASTARSPYGRRSAAGCEPPSSTPRRWRRSWSSARA
jgi:hypothetical protein